MDTKYSHDFCWDIITHPSWYSSKTCLKFASGYIISHLKHFNGHNYLTTAGGKVNLCQQRGPLGCFNKWAIREVVNSLLACVFYCLTYILMPHNMIVHFCVYLISMSQRVFYFLHSASVVSFYIYAVLILSYDSLSEPPQHMGLKCKCEPQSVL